MEDNLKFMNLIRTCDPYIFIEEQYDGYVRYISFHPSTYGKRWEVYGICNNCGKCWEGAVSPKPELDCPINEFFTQDGCPLSVKLIEPYK